MDRNLEIVAQFAPSLVQLGAASQPYESSDSSDPAELDKVAGYRLVVHPTGRPKSVFFTYLFSNLKQVCGEYSETAWSVA